MARNNRTIFDLGQAIYAWRSRNPEATRWVDVGLHETRRIRMFGAPMRQQNTLRAAMAALESILFMNPTQRQVMETLEAENRLPSPVGWVRQEREIIVNPITIEVNDNIPPYQIHVQGNSRQIIITDVAPPDEAAVTEGYPLPEDYVSMESVRLNLAQRMNEEGVGFAGLTLEAWHQMWRDAEAVGMAEFENIMDNVVNASDLRAAIREGAEHLRRAAQMSPNPVLNAEARPEQTEPEYGVRSEGYRGHTDFSKVETVRTLNADEDLDALFAEIDALSDEK